MKKKFIKKKRRSSYKQDFLFEKRGCRICAGEVTIDYKQPNVLRHYITDRSKIISPKFTGICAKHQRKLSLAIKRSRILALLPFIT